MKGIEEEAEASLVGLTIRTSSPASSSSKKGKDLLQTHNNASDSSPSIKNSPFNSPSLVSPPSSAFVSALQSPYISPRATTPITTHKPSPPLSYKGSQSEDVPSSSYTPPSDQYEFSDEQPSDRKLKLSACTPDPAPPRISFSFPVPRVSLAKVSVSSPATNTKLRSSDVFIGFHGQNPNLVRFCKWLKSELELQGIACFVADRANYSDTQSHEIADRVICSVTYGIVVVSCSSLLNYLSLEEVRFFAQKKNLIPIFYGTGPSEIMGLLNCNAIDKECKEAIDGLIKSHEFKLEANESNWRSCVGKTATILRAKLGRKSVADKEIVEGIDELPFPRNRSFLGREKEIIEMEMALFGNGEYLESTTPSTRGEALRGRRKKDYPVEEVEVLKLFDEKLGRLSYGLWVVGSLLSELAIPPSALFEAVNKIQIEERSASPFLNVIDEQYCKSNPFVAKVLAFSLAVLEQAEGNRNLLSLKMLLVGAWFAPVPIPVNLLAAAAKNMPTGGNRFSKWNKCLSHTFAWCGGCGLGRRSEEDAAFLLVRLGLARITNRQPGCWIQFHPITQTFARRRDYILAPKATVQGVRKIDNPLLNLDHLWASAFLVFGFKSEPPLVQLQAMDMVLYIKRTALPLAITAFTTFSRCNSALELLKVCTNVLEEVEKSFVSQIQDWRQGSLCWKKKTNKKVDEYVWQDVTLLKALLLETRAKLLLRGGHFDSGEELCRTCISIRTVMLGHNHDLTLAAQETLAKLVRMRSKI
ncbi:LOW QUALITY PROTEIN: uncharacterized protein LOC9298818 [Arabidopsis lyrata subsp. lyrata]|uniref:LOW QUALITY PROTEIN: uncharacterized protein LOC9298818 n=1 Tax=Arabidopsis lyrata subsp. lyrata TaxID=81972 RepID=UPI000A29C4E1|nr:LOW QUALITY PROTEIN: uncharacterized protein LOC9298818 [Arabidopsis lyrata subsp. lyrata]|eukprot:XP_020872433.1 LOW QUALITY PROTEIN: uncharacterized protein LOC9298818 [Arabidopsis lyrata subsp. lyrata]